MDEKRIEVIELPVRELKTGFGNPRKIKKKKKDELKVSLDTFGDFGLILIDEDNNIIAGNQRVSILKEKDEETVVLCKRLIGYSEAELRAINIKDNTHSGEWDIDMIADWTADLTVDLGLEEMTKKDTKERKINEMELVAFEKYDYVIIACRSYLDYDDLTSKLGLSNKTAKITNKRSIKARAVWYENVRDLMFGGK